VPGIDSLTSALVWVDRSGRTVSGAVDELLDDPRGVRLSPNGDQLALVTGLGDLWIHNFDGRPPLRLNEDNSALPAWSPDGKQVVFASNRRGGAYEVYTLPADGSAREPRQLGPDGWNARPEVWLGGGKLLLDQGGANDLDIVEAPAEAKGAVEDVVATDYLEYHAALSPDGRWLAYISDRTGESEVWVQPYPKGVAERVSRGGRARQPVWSHDGEELFYLRANTMMAVAVETDSEFSFEPGVPLFSQPFVVHGSVYWRSYDVARDGRFLMIQRATGAGDAAGLSSILVVQNWFAELERRVPTE